MQLSPLEQRLAGRWTLHTHIGDRVFQDELRLAEDPKDRSELQGTLSVPGGFTAPVLDLDAENGDRFEFSIEPDEGQGKFRVNYQAQFDPNEPMFVGFLHLADGKLLGGFVAKPVSAATG
jgi:hypothetical protein